MANSKETKKNTNDSSESILQTSSQPIKLNYELIMRSKKADFKQHKLTKAKLIVIAYQYFLDTYKNPESESGQGIEKQYLDLIG